MVYEELEWESSPLQQQASHLLLVEKSLVIPYFKSEVMTVPATLWDSAVVLNTISAGPEGGWSSKSSSLCRNLQAFSCLFNPRLAHGFLQPVHLQITFSEGARLAICDKKQGWSSVIGYFNFVLSTCANFMSLHPLILVLIPSCVKYIAHIVAPGHHLYQSIKLHRMLVIIAIHYIPLSLDLIPLCLNSMACSALIKTRCSLHLDTISINQ